MFNGKTTDYQQATITNDGFWPDIEVGEFEQGRAIPADMQPETVAAAVLSAVAQVNIELMITKSKLQAEGHWMAAEVDGPHINGQNQLEILYRQAVFARAKADLVVEFGSVTQRDTGNNQATQSGDARAALLAESQQHIRAIKGVHRCGIELL
ncbi:head completion/stabilization protein [Oceanisphaera arctica]|uniref:Head protein n=1 Tax=Oceanisphaera arctica TaxID=641510 RepID=A0A2P5TMW8_9GAMM|nr:head completion/stabilization protein [Oceanisphaera arctica]PPL16805.1 head protein [Oceanisphaera arctica]GHA05630.1 head completion/stabilization protein (GpL) from bacteriophage origin [Oceanisphaera arctica]